jgi:hypothetical protein
MCYADHIADVRRSVPAEKLLELDSTELVL